MKIIYEKPNVKEMEISFRSIVCTSRTGATKPYSINDDYEIGGGDGNTQIF